VAENKKRPPVGTIGVVQQKIFGLPVDRKMLFSNHKNVYKKKIEKRQRNLIIKISFLKSFIRDNEKVLCVTMGHTPVTILEKLGVGWLFIYLKRCLLVFTDQRVLSIPTTPTYKYRHAVAEILYGSCKSIRMKGRNLIVEYKKPGAAEKFFSLAGKEKKKITNLLKNIALKSDGNSVDKRTNLCPRCGTALAEKTSTCEGCELKFKTKLIASILTVVLPGGGYFYVRQHFLGAMAALLEIALFSAAAIAINDFSNGIQTGHPWLLATPLLLILEKIVAVIHANTLIEDFIPNQNKITVMPAKNYAN
jgi:hypothetical protein